MPSAWTERSCAYLLLSDLYEADAERAASHGWPVRQLSGAHLDIVTRPVEVVDLLIELSDAA